VNNNIRVLLSSLLGPWIAWGVAWIGAKTGVVFTEAQVSALTEIAVYLTLALVAGKLVARQSNPHNVADPKAMNQEPVPPKI
jgi:hypothetical protein